MKAERGNAPCYLSRKQLIATKGSKGFPVFAACLESARQNFDPDSFGVIPPASVLKAIIADRLRMYGGWPAPRPQRRRADRAGRVMLPCPCRVSGAPACASCSP